MVVTLMATMLVAGAGQAGAQGAAASESKMFLGIDVGAQPQQRTTTSSTSFPLYDETATVTTNQPIHNGPVFGVSGGYRVRPNLAIALGVTMFNARSADSSVVASIPDLVFFNRPKVVTAAATGLKHQELGVHIQAVWFHTLNEKIGIALSAGPSLINVKHDLATATVATGTQNVTTATATEKKSAPGFNAGGEATYKLTPRLGAALFVRYVGGKVDLPSLHGLKVGGLQAGLGIRIGF